MKTKFLLFFLLLANIVIAKDYKAGEVQSKQSFHYGKFEARFYASDASGVLSTFFLFENTGWQTTDIWQEIDVEVFGKDPGNLWQTNVIYETNAAGPQHHSEGTHTLSNNEVVADWHTYTIEWTPDYIEWFVDETSVRKFTDASVLDIIGAKPMQVMLNCWSHSSEAWVGPLDVQSLPTFQFVDYVKVYDWTDGANFGNTPVFEDNFDNGLVNWNASNHTFDGNVADFTSSNVGVKDGYLLLAFSTNSNADLIANAIIPTDPVTSFNKGYQKTDLLIYPNPTSNNLTLSRKSNWHLYSSLGTDLKSGYSDKIDLSDLQSGMYILKITEGDNEISRTVYKE